MLGRYFAVGLTGSLVLFAAGCGDKDTGAPVSNPSSVNMPSLEVADSQGNQASEEEGFADLDPDLLALTRYKTFEEAQEAMAELESVLPDGPLKFYADGGGKLAGAIANNDLRRLVDEHGIDKDEVNIAISTHAAIIGVIAEPYGELLPAEEEALRAADVSYWTPPEQLMRHEAFLTLLLHLRAMNGYGEAIPNNHNGCDTGTLADKMLATPLGVNGLTKEVGACDTTGDFEAEQSQESLTLDDDGASSDGRETEYMASLWLIKGGVDLTEPAKRVAKVVDAARSELQASS